MQEKQNQTKIVVVDDDKSDRAYARHALEKYNYCVYEAMNGHRLKEILCDYPVDLVLLDLKMPGEDGINLISVIRNKTDAPIIIVSGLQALEDKKNSLHNGADDYITKPFYPAELQARIHANLRRYERSIGYSAQKQPMIIGSWILNHDIADICDMLGKPRGLTIQEFNLVDKLVKSNGRAMPRNELSNHSGGRSIDIHVTRIRKKLEDPDFIQTVRGLGYRIPTKNHR